MSLSEEVAGYIADRCNQKLEKFDKETASQLKNQQADGVGAYEQERLEKRVVLQQDHQPDAWLDKAVVRANQIQLATHAPKFTHADAKGGSVNSMGHGGDRQRLGTHSIGSPTIDVTGNAAALDVANLLLLQHNDDVLWQQLASKDTAALKPFAKDENQLSSWMKGFHESLLASSFFSHSLCKQLYFPVENTEYHLIAPLFATSLCHSMHEVFRHTRFDESSVEARKHKRDNKGYMADVVSYPNAAEMSFGGSKPQNISLLNSQRRGVATLLNAAPPIWQHKERLPVKGRNAFWRTYSRQTRGRVRVLNLFLNRVKDYSNIAIRNTRAEMITQLVEDWLYLVARLRSLGEPGWSIDSDLPVAEQCLLDPSRTDDNSDSKFSLALEDGSWRADVAAEFGRWINNSLKSDTRVLGDAEANVWAREVDNTLSRLRNDLEYL